MDPNCDGVSLDCWVDCWGAGWVATCAVPAQVVALTRTSKADRSFIFIFICIFIFIFVFSVNRMPTPEPGNPRTVDGLRSTWPVRLRSWDACECIRSRTCGSDNSGFAGVPLFGFDAALNRTLSSLG